MHTNAGELFGSSLLVHLVVEEVGDRFVVKVDKCLRAGLLDELNILDKQQVIAGRNAKSANFRVTIVTQEQQLGPRSRAEA